MAADKRMKALLAEVERQGGRVRQGKHLVVKCPWVGTERCGNDNGIAVLGSTDSDHRAYQNSRTRLKRCGFTV